MSCSLCGGKHFLAGCMAPEINQTFQKMKEEWMIRFLRNYDILGFKEYLLNTYNLPILEAIVINKFRNPSSTNKMGYVLIILHHFQSNYIPLHLQNHISRELEKDRLKREEEQIQREVKQQLQKNGWIKMKWHSNFQIVINLEHFEIGMDKKANNTHEEEMEEDADIECSICYETINYEKIIKLNCNHLFCVNCVKTMLQSHIPSCRPCCALCRSKIEEISTQRIVSVI